MRLKTIKLNIVFIIIAINLQAQQTKESLVGKIFSAKVGYICEETPEPNPCAGQQIFLVLQFNKEEVTITEKNRSSCDKETVAYQFKYAWSLDDEVVVINSNPEEVRYTYLEKLKLNLKNGKLKGAITYPNGQDKEYDFKENIK
ncbi:hypothetical protein [Tenacibaculum jejuense]|uniref:Uncharacterized protein n=1 Tax=Tenacibaculum jejuense TaxID=584609 RepID=A0A238UEG2_9FLAO|nr:hypothetical protein [Tenacibaculum jejuense]SNR16864.1 protein of unknown function [Tenacibaculum jejuense]